MYRRLCAACAVAGQRMWADVIVSEAVCMVLQVHLVQPGTGASSLLAVGRCPTSPHCKAALQLAKSLLRLGEYCFPKVVVNSYSRDQSIGLGCLAGGRYDGLLKSLWPPAMGTPMGAVGVTLNVERLFALAAPHPKRGRPPALQASQVPTPHFYPSQGRELLCLRLHCIPASLPPWECLDCASGRCTVQDLVSTSCQEEVLAGMPCIGSGRAVPCALSGCRLLDGRHTDAYVHAEQILNLADRFDFVSGYIIWFSG